MRKTLSPAVSIFIATIVLCVGLRSPELSRIHFSLSIDAILVQLLFRSQGGKTVHLAADITRRYSPTHSKLPDMLALPIFLPLLCNAP